MAETLVELALEWPAFAKGDLAIAQGQGRRTCRRSAGPTVALHCKKAAAKTKSAVD